MVTRSRTSSWKQMVYLTLCQALCTNLVFEPISVKNALVDLKWKHVMIEEYTTLMKNHAWSLVLPTDGMNIVGHKGIFRVKYQFDGSILKYKTMLVVYDFHQTLEIDILDTFSLVIKPLTIRVVFTFAMSYGWPI